MAPQLRTGAALEQALSLALSGSQPTVSSVPGNLTLSSDPQGHQVHGVHSFMQANTYIH